MRFTQIFLLFVFIVFISSCQTYHLSTKSLVEQFASSSPEKKTKYLGYFSARLFLFIPFSVTGNDLQAINVLDKKEKEKTLEITSHTGIRITENNGNRTTFYFNTLSHKAFGVMNFGTFVVTKYDKTTYFYQSKCTRVRYNNST